MIVNTYMSDQPTIDTQDPDAPPPPPLKAAGVVQRDTSSCALRFVAQTATTHTPTSPNGSASGMASSHCLNPTSQPVYLLRASYDEVLKT